MSNKRAQLRRQQRELNKLPAPVNVRGFSREMMASSLGVKIQLLDEWAEAQRRDFCVEFNEKLRDAENYVAFTNVLISCMAIHMTWGYTKAIGKFIDNLNPAMEFVKRTGVRKTYEIIEKEYGHFLEFDDFEVEDFIRRAEDAVKNKTE